MCIALRHVTAEECGRLHELQQLGFRALLDKYNDVTTNPGAESQERILSRFDADGVDQYWIVLDAAEIGYIRIQQMEGGVCRLSQMFILPDFQSKGYAQLAIALAEAKYPHAKRWELDTIKQETKLCHLYEKMGYRLTGAQKQIQPGMDLADYAKEPWNEICR